MKKIIYVAVTIYIRAQIFSAGCLALYLFVIARGNVSAGDYWFFDLFIWITGLVAMAIFIAGLVAVRTRRFTSKQLIHYSAVLAIFSCIIAGSLLLFVFKVSPFSFHGVFIVFITGAAAMSVVSLLLSRQILLKSRFNNLSY